MQQNIDGVGMFLPGGAIGGFVLTVVGADFMAPSVSYYLEGIFRGDSLVLSSANLAALNHEIYLKTYRLNVTDIIHPDPLRGMSFLHSERGAFYFSSASLNGTVFSISSNSTIIRTT